MVFKTGNVSPLKIDIKIIGVPKTIDNDLYYTDHTPGFGSAAKFVTTVLSEIVCDSTVYNIHNATRCKLKTGFWSIKNHAGSTKII